jgi:hypothetical protein
MKMDPMEVGYKDVNWIVCNHMCWYVNVQPSDSLARKLLESLYMFHINNSVEYFRCSHME